MSMHPKASRPWTGAQFDTLKRCVNPRRGFRIVSSQLLFVGHVLERSWAAVSLRENGLSPGDIFSTEWNKASRFFVVRETDKGQRLLECDRDGLPLLGGLVLTTYRYSFTEDHEADLLRITG